MKVETLRWTDNKLEMIDQRILPAAFEYLAYDSAASVAEGIRSMVVRGAPAIGDRKRMEKHGHKVFALCEFEGD